MIRRPPRTTLFPYTSPFRTTLTIGTVTDGPSGMTASGITTSNDDVKLTVLAGGLGIGAAADAGADDITLGSGNLTLNVVRNITQISRNVILASCLQLLGSGTVTLNDTGNNVSTLAATYIFFFNDTATTEIYTLSLHDALPILTASGITTSHDDVKLTVLAGGLGLGAAADAGADDITLGSGNLTLNVVGAVTQISGNVILASGLQLLGSEIGRPNVCTQITTTSAIP